MSSADDFRFGLIGDYLSVRLEKVMLAGSLLLVDDPEHPLRLTPHLHHAAMLVALAGADEGFF